MKATVAFFLSACSLVFAGLPPSPGFLSATQRDWAYSVTLQSHGGGAPDNLPWPAMTASQLQSLQQDVMAAQQAMESGGNLVNGHVVDVLKKAKNLTAVAGAYETVGDSAMWTGSYLAAQAMRLAVNPGDATALEQVNTTLGVLELLATCSSKDGYVVRAALPTLDPAYAAYYAEYKEGHYVCASPHQDLTWLGKSSRDSYTGYAMGLAAVLWALPSVPPAAPLVERARQLAAKVATTMQEDKWFILGPHGAVTNPSPTFQATWEQLAIAADPSRFNASGTHPADYNATVWTALDTLGFDLKGLHEAEYFSNNLLISSLFAQAALIATAHGSASAPAKQALAKKAHAIAVGSGTAHFEPQYAALAACALRALGQPLVDADLRVAQGVLQGALGDQHPPPKWMRTVNMVLQPEYFPHFDKGTKMAEHALLAGDRPQDAYQWQIDPTLLAGGVASPYLYAEVDRILPFWAGRFCGLLEAGN